MHYGISNISTNIVNRSNAATVETVESEMSTDSTRDSANSMSPPLSDERFIPGSSGEQQRHLSTDSTRDSGIGPDDPQKSSLAAYLPCNLLSYFRKCIFK